MHFSYNEQILHVKMYLRTKNAARPQNARFFEVAEKKLSLDRAFFQDLKIDNIEG